MRDSLPLIWQIITDQEIIAGICKNNHSDRDSIKLLTKWVPKPGPINKEAVYKAIMTSLERMNQKVLTCYSFIHGPIPIHIG